MVSRFKEHILKHSLFEVTDRLILGLSGGADSVALFHLLRLSGFNFVVAHVNFGLRGKESNKDEQFVQKLCAEFKIDYHLKKVPPGYWDSDALNIQGEARNIRYRFFNRLVKNKSDKILTAHNQDDNLETVLMNFSRGTGLSGMNGIQPVNGNIVRPILKITRKEIENFLNENSLNWREDQSNKSLKYKRNRFRHTIIPEMKKENPALLQAFERYLANMEPVYNYFKKGLATFKKQNLKFENEGLKLKWRTGEELNLFLFDVLSEFGFNSTQVSDIKGSVSFAGKFFESETHRLTIDRNCILIRRISKNNKFANPEVKINETTISVSNPLKLQFSFSEKIDIIKEKSVGQFDYEKLRFPLTLRRWHPGDKMNPLGLEGKKKISDILIDKKIPLPDKENIYVLKSNGNIIWLVGLVISEDYKISDKTRKVWTAGLIK